MFFNFFFWIFGACFQPKNPTYLSGRILLSLLKLKNKLSFFKSEDKILLDKYVRILGWKHAPKIQKKKLKNIRSPQNFDLIHSLGENRW